MIDISYEICAVLISLVILMNIIRTKRTHNLQNIIFQLMIISNGLTAVFDIAKRLHLQYASQVSVTFIEVCTEGYFVTHLLALPFLYIYALSIVRSWKDFPLYHKIMSVLPVSVVEGITLCNSATSWVFHIEADGTYVRGNGIYLLYLITGFYLFQVIFILIRYRKNYTLSKRLTFYSSLGFLTVGIAIQFVFPKLLVETVFNSICLLIFFFVIQNPHNQLDHNTGMFNRMAFRSIVGNSLANRKAFAIIIIVIENLTDVSLQEREMLMCMVSNYLKSLGRTFVIYRIDDNSFVLTITERSEEIVEAIAEEIQKKFKKSWQGLSNRLILKPRICFLFFPSEITKMDDLRAVFNDFKEKNCEDGRIYRESDFELKKIVRTSQVSNALVLALEEDRFELNYTPIFDLRKGKLFAAEGNLKFLDGELGYVYEEEIQRVAEKGGKMAHLSEWVLEQTCRTISENHLDQTRLRMIFVRLSTGLCLQYSYEDIILENIRKHNIPPSMICFLVSEYTVSSSAQLLKQGMRKLKENGISFCLENYGSGYTNLASLYELPFDYIEISRTVISEALANEKAKVILEATLNLAKSLDIQTIVSGVNSEEQKLLLNTMPCDYALGTYFLGQMEKKDFLALIDDSPLNSMEGRYLVKMRLEEKLAKEKEEAEKRAEFLKARKRKNPVPIKQKEAGTEEKKGAD